MNKLLLTGGGEQGPPPVTQVALDFDKASSQVAVGNTGAYSGLVAGGTPFYISYQIQFKSVSAGDNVWSTTEAAGGALGARITHLFNGNQLEIRLTSASQTFRVIYTDVVSTGVTYHYIHMFNGDGSNFGDYTVHRDGVALVSAANLSTFSTPNLVFGSDGNSIIGALGRPGGTYSEYADAIVDRFVCRSTAINTAEDAATIFAQPAEIKYGFEDLGIGGIAGVTVNEGTLGLSENLTGVNGPTGVAGL